MYEPVMVTRESPVSDIIKVGVLILLKFEMGDCAKDIATDDAKPEEKVLIQLHRFRFFLKLMNRSFIKIFWFGNFTVEVVWLKSH